MDGENSVRIAEVVEAGKPLRVKTIPRPLLPPHMVRIKVAFAGVCHSDLHILDELEDFQKEFGTKPEGLVLGHEIAGYVEEIGQDVGEGRFSVGYRVVLCPWKGCLECDACRVGLNNQCPNNPLGSKDVGQSLENPGGYQSHINVYPDFLLKVDPALGLDVACMVPCSATTAYCALKKATANIKMAAKRSGTARLLIIGAGGLGLWAVTLAKVMFDNVHVTSTDIDETKLTLAKEMGADDVIATDRKATPQESKDRITKSWMFDAAIDFVGSSTTSEMAVLSLQTGGAMVVVGLFGGNFSCPLSLIIGRSLTVQGSRVGGRKDTAEVLDLVIKKGLTFQNIKYVDHNDINEALDSLAKGQVNGRSIIKY